MSEPAQPPPFPGADSDGSGHARPPISSSFSPHADRLRDELAWTKLDRHRLESILDDVSHRLASATRELEEVRAAERAGRDANLAILRDAATAERRHEAELRERDDRARESVQAVAERLDAALAAHDGALGEIERLRAVVARHAHERASLLASRSWRITRPLRAASSFLGGGVPEPSPIPTEPKQPTPTAAPPSDTPAVIELAITASLDTTEADVPSEATPASGSADINSDTLPAPATRPSPAGWRPIHRILFVSGEPGTPGAIYRVERNAAACRAAGYEAETVDLLGIDPDILARADLIVLWRAEWSGHVGIMIELAHAAGTRVCFDADDLTMLPDLASAEWIDGIRTTSASEVETRSYFRGTQRALQACDSCTVTTAELARGAGTVHPVIQVIPNGFDAGTERESRRAVRLRGERPADGKLRVGYAGGTRTHQKDFAVAVDALARVLAARPTALLVLFRDGHSGEGLVLLNEFPALLPFADRVEWRDMVPLAELPGELARFDVSLCPLEQGNPFCEAKSELKWFESALAGVPLVASPTGPFQRAIQDGVTGFLAEDEAGWERAILSLLDDPALRHRMARNAYHDAIWRFGPRRQAELWAGLLAGMGTGAPAARATALSLLRGDYLGAGLPEVPEGELLFAYDSLGDARVTVGMTSFNYAHHLPEALGSVRAQTLARLDLVVVDDGSSDGSVPLLLEWAERERLRFNRVRILRTARNSGLGGARNLVFAESETPYVMVLDSDNRLAPECCERLLDAVDADGLAAFAYPVIRQFGAPHPTLGDLATGEDGFDPARLASGNYIDAMALVAKWAWAAAGGYYVRKDAMGWEDYTLWCRLVEFGLYGVQVKEDLAFYRVHPNSMVNAITEQTDSKRRIVELAERRHPWLRLRTRQAHQRR